MKNQDFLLGWWEVIRMETQVIYSATKPWLKLPLRPEKTHFLFLPDGRHHWYENEKLAHLNRFKYNPEARFLTTESYSPALQGYSWTYFCLEPTADPNQYWFLTS